MSEEHWYKEAIIYELHVKCFFDSCDDGMGDFQGLTQKLDYLQDLGITAIWLLPFYPSPLKDDGYDIADYMNVHPSYGKLKDFRKFLKEAHRRNIRVITELVLNHTSDQHPWFKRARSASKKSKLRDYYVWSETPDYYKDARVIFQDFESSNWAWDPVAKSYYWHRFYSHQPDLNYENPEVRRSIYRILSFWLKMGVDGLRLDAVPYLFQREGTNCENLPETHAFLREIRKFVDDNYPNRMLLAEANQWPEDAAKYFGLGDECHMAFHFPVMPRLFMSIQQEDSLPIIEIMGQTPEIPEVCQWALFLRNHDELTLEMVTDEERDYMFRVYAHLPQARLNLGIRRRLAPLLKNDRRKIELMNSLLFSLTGTPVLYYGDELGMGDNVFLGDRNGVRTPMQWSNDRNAGFSRANPQQLYLPPIIDPEYHYETVNVEAQHNNPYSLLWWTKQLIYLRKRYKSFSYGTTEFLGIENRKVLVFFREYEDELIMIIANLSRFAQYVELDLSKYEGSGLIEMFSGQHFPKIGELPYFLTLGPYGYYWFLLERRAKESLLELFDREREKQYMEISISKSAERIFQKGMRRILETAVRRYLLRRIWFKPYIQLIDRGRIADHLTFYAQDSRMHIIFFEIMLRNAAVKQIPLFLMYFQGEEARKKLDAFPESIIIKFKNQKNPEETHILFDMTMDPKVFEILLGIIDEKKKIKTEKGEIKGILLPPSHQPPRIQKLNLERQNVHREEDAIIFPYENGIVRLFWKMDEGMNIDVELRLFLTKKTNFRQFLPLMGYIEYSKGEKTAVALAEEIGSFGKGFSAKTLAITAADRFITKMAEVSHDLNPKMLHLKKTFLEASKKKLPEKFLEYFEQDLEVATLLGETSADLHTSLAAEEEDLEFKPIPFSLFYQRSLYQNIRRKILEAFDYLQKHPNEEFEKEIEKTIFICRELLVKLQILPHEKLGGYRMRFHGNYILENLNYTGKEFYISNFEGNLNCGYNERRYKRSCLIDIASIFMSFFESALEAEKNVLERPTTNQDCKEEIHFWASAWSDWMCSAFLHAYLKKLKTDFIPEDQKEIDFLLAIFLLERCMEQITQGKIKYPVLTLLHFLPRYENFKLR